MKSACMSNSIAMYREHKISNLKRYIILNRDNYKNNITEEVLKQTKGIIR